MKTVAIVPLKLNNERCPGKNTRHFTNGKPLCTYILNTLSNCDFIDEIYVFCSDEKIIKFIPKGVKFLKREASLDTQATSMNQILLSFCNKVNADIYILAHATSPFVSKKVLKRE